MSYKAAVLKVMIASPGDVERERRIAREVIQEWNAVNSEDKSTVLMPVGWETHSSPSMDSRAQEVINKQVLEDCDLLIGIFWTRIGTPTGEYASGTVEEINEHISAGKPAMIYFSSAPVVLDSVDKDQYAALTEFKEELKKKGLIETYESIGDFKDKLSRQLALTVIREFGSETNGEIDSTPIPVETHSKLNLSEDAAELLVAAVQEGRGDILALRTIAGQSIQAGGKNFTEKGNPRSEAKWHRALDELEGLGLIRDRGYKSEIFEVTADGYDVADALILES